VSSAGSHPGLAAFRHSTSICETDRVGPRTRIRAFTHVLSGAQIGADCDISEHVFVENDVVIGDRVTVQCGVSVWDGLRIEDDVFVGPNVAFTNDPFPRSGRHQPEPPLTTTVRKGASLGANCTILPGLTVGAKAMVGAGSVLTRDVPSHAIVAGNPARIVGYAGTEGNDRLRATRVEPPSEHAERPQRLEVRGVSLYRLVRADDLRGSLVAAEVGSHIPFDPRRAFCVMQVPSKDVRGAHAHRRCEQFLICLAGSVAVVVDDGRRRAEVMLDDPSLGLHLPAMTWGVQYRYSANALLLILASRPYESADYIHDYDEFLALVEGRGSRGD